ncbi:nucleoside-triphosphatase [uncultured Clostridium sp.]|uniref:nucleoside-triphosphatase n=1 Tax=uncultured Clostridium sp. TaxID=59620 RepID=UPI0028EE9240|nr:nucleoside-triphosphatase [uncultured Clostridium sp.]
MINIVTGKVNSGKTSKLIDIFNTLGKGDGFFNRKIYIDGCYIGQEIVVMSTGESRAWSHRVIPPGKWQQDFCYETYSFSKDGLEFAENIITPLLSSAIEPIYIDEIGPLELQEKGFHKLFMSSVVSKKELYVVIRESCIKDVIEKYNIENYKMIYSNSEK